MKRTQRLLARVLVLALLATGCRQPPQGTPVSFTDEELTAIAGTAQAFAQKTAAASSPTPLPPTSTPQASLISGTSLILRDDGTALFTDHRAGIQLIIPAGWLPVRPNEDEYYKAFTHEAIANNQSIIDHLTNIQASNTDFLRLDAIDIRPDHTVDGIVTYITVIFEEDDTRSLEKWNQAERATKKPFKGFKFLSSTIKKLENGTRVLIIEERWDSGSSATYYRGVFFSLPTGTLVLDFYTNIAFKDTVLPDFESVVNSLGPIAP
jgi:hypothetical protein